MTRKIALLRKGILDFKNIVIHIPVLIHVCIVVEGLVESFE